MNALFDSVRHRVAIHVNRMGLPQPVGAIFRLAFDGGIPPAVKMKDIGGALQVQSHPAGTQREDEYAVVVVLEAFDDAVALG